MQSGIASKRHLRTSNNRVNLLEQGISIVAHSASGLDVPSVVCSNLPWKAAATGNLVASACGSYMLQLSNPHVEWEKPWVRREECDNTSHA